MKLDDPRHGTTAGYHAGCRCAACLTARARYEKQCRLDRLRGGRAVPAIGAQRRIEALMALGWSSAPIAEAAGFAHRNSVLRILRGQKGKPCTWLERKTHDAISRAYDELSMKLPPSTAAVNRSRAWAARLGYLPPLAWDEGALDDPNATPAGSRRDRVRRPHDVDPVAVDRVLAGDTTVDTTRAEREEVCRRWVEMGRSLKELEGFTGWRTARYFRLRDEVA